MQRIALGVLSPIRPDAKEFLYMWEGAPVTPPKGDGEGYYHGIISSVAPVESLLDLAAEEGLPITKVLYLRSSATQKRDFVKALGMEVSAEDYFRTHIYEYFERANGRLGMGPQSADDASFFVPVEYHIGDPASSIQGILDALGTDDVLVDVDTTGGLRDAATLITMVIQIIKTRYSAAAVQSNAALRPGLGNTVYARADFDTGLGDISRQGRTYDLIDLFHAVESFTHYGKARELIEFFGQKSADSTDELVALCKSMGDFSDALSVCNMAKIPARVSEIYDCVRRLRARHANGETSAHRAEVLFVGLLDGLEKDFVVDVGPNPSLARWAEQIISTIRWCVSRQLQQQALALVREFYPRCMESLGYLGWGSVPLVPPSVNGRGRKGSTYRRKVNEERIARVEQLCFFRTKNAYAIDSRKLSRVASRESGRLPGPGPTDWNWRHLCGILHAWEVADSRYVTVAAGHEDVLPAMLIWYQTLLSLRNESAHANHGGNRSIRNRNARVYEAVLANADEVLCEYDKTHRLDSLSRDICKAMDALEGKIVLRVKKA